ncbi:MAG: hypothetical protein IID40_10505, partial [Planctomycetes bacterium]|nr:hypothetical protein [Planctomycetota bacterium]
MGFRDSSSGLEKARAGVTSGATIWRRVALLGTINLALVWGCTSVGGGGGSQGSSRSDGTDGLDEPTARSSSTASTRLAAGTGFALTDFFVDPVQANPDNPHEVLGAPFSKFRLHIEGQFDQARCYQVRIKRSNVFDGTFETCGSAGASGFVDVPSIDPNDGFENRFISDTEMLLQVRPNAASNFRAADNWVIHVRERSAGCSGSSTELTWPLDEATADPADYLSIFSCDLQCDSPDDECDDGNACTIGTCNVDLGICEFTPLVCDDANGCTDDTCDVALGCQFPDNADPCDDSL